MDRQMVRQTDSKAGGAADRQKRKAGRKTARQACRRAGGQRDRLTIKRRDKEMDGKKFRADRQTVCLRENNQQSDGQTDLPTGR